jgi:hypothetical protein
MPYSLSMSNTAMTTTETSREARCLEIYGSGEPGTTIDVRSPAHMRYDRDPRIAPCPALVGWVNYDEDYHGTPVYSAMYAGPYAPAATRFAAFADQAEAVQWIARLFAEEG